VYVSPITWLDCDKEHTHGLRLMQARGRTGALAWPRHGQTNHVVPATPGEHATPGRTAPGADHCVGGPCRRRPDHAGRGSRAERGGGASSPWLRQSSTQTVAVLGGRRETATEKERGTLCWLYFDYNSDSDGVLLCPRDDEAVLVTTL
jgi:hypothetical protein